MKSKIGNNYTKLTKFEMLIEDLNKEIENVFFGYISSYNYTMKLIYDYDKLNDYGKIIFKKSNCDYLLSRYVDIDFNNLKIKIEASKELVELCINFRENAYRFIFWALMILSVDETDKDEKLSLICDFASMMNVKEHELVDITKIIKLIYGKKYSKSDFVSTKIKDFFKDVLKRYNINV